MNTHLHSSLKTRFAAPGSRRLRLLAAACGFALLLACRADARPVTWEYRVVNAGLQNRQLEALLNSNGADRWELVQITSKGVAVFKRPKLK